MRYRWSFALIMAFVCCLVAAGKDKKKILLPNDILDARTVLVVIDPDAGVDVEAPLANRTAQQDVEKALMNWGRFTMAMDVSTADIIVVVRKGNGKIAQPTVGGIPNNNRPVILEPTDSTTRVGVHSGNPPQAGDPTNSQPQNPHEQVEMGQPQDMFVLYRGKRDEPLDSPAVWRYSAKGALRSPDVPAVDAFRKLVLEADKQRASKP